VFREEIAADDSSWRRGRGWTIYQAATALAYYKDTNPGMIRQASRALAEVLADADEQFLGQS
jgi:aminoglycoside phosphotransferase (APT) family kinase protein